MRRIEELRAFWRTGSLVEAQATRIATDWPVPWSAERVATCFNALTLERVMTGAAVLDVGCGVGRFTREALDRGATKAYAVDVSPAMLAHTEDYCSAARERLVVVLSDGDSWSGVPDGSCDAAWCFLVLQHCWTRKAACALIDGMLLALRPGGTLFLQGHEPKGKFTEATARGFEGVDSTPEWAEGYLGQRVHEVLVTRRLFQQPHWWAVTAVRA